jgi:hypothetical protein
MAKVQGPLMSMSASGTIGKSITFDKRGHVRNRVVPANPQSPDQGNVRQMLLGVQKAIKRVGATVIAAIKTLAPTSYRWNSFLLQAVLGAGSSEFIASRIAYLALSQAQRDSWEAEALALGLVDQSLVYASDPVISAGLALFAVSRALYRLGINVADGAPSGTNQIAWHDYYIS